jgi:hypothetical protein
VKAARGVWLPAWTNSNLHKCRECRQEGPVKAARGVWLLEERGLAFPMTLFVLVVLALLAAALGSSTASGLKGARLADWNRKALYAAEAGVEHQIHLLKEGSPEEGSPAPASGSLGGSPPARYRVTRVRVLDSSRGCSLPQQAGRWEITARGELVQGAAVVTRSVQAVVEICFLGSSPQRVFVEDWREL